MSIQISITTVRMNAKFDGQCGFCAKPFTIGSEIKYNHSLKSAFCLSCPEQATPSSINPGKYIVPAGHYYIQPPNNHWTQILRIHQVKRGTYAGNTMIQRY